MADPQLKPFSGNLDAAHGKQAQAPSLQPFSGALDGEQGSFSRGLETAARQIPQTGGGALGLIGDAIGSDAVRDAGMRIYKGQDDKIKELSRPSDSFSNVLEGQGDLGEFVKYGAGYVGGQALSALATGGVGGFVGRKIAQKGVERAVAAGAEKYLAGEAGQAAAQQAVQRGTIAGASAAQGGSNLMQEAGSIYPDAVEQAEKDGRTLTGGDLARVGGSAVAAAGLDTLMDAKMLHGVMGGASSAPTLARRAIRTIPGTLAREAGTEAAQTGIERWGAQQSLSDSDAVRDYIDSAALGGLGGALGGAAGAIRRQEGGHAAPIADQEAPGPAVDTAEVGPDAARAPAGPGAGAAAEQAEPAAGPLTPAEIRAFNNAYRREVPDPLGDLQARVRGETAYTGPDQVQQVSREVEDAWLRDNLAQVDQAVAAAAPLADAAAVPEQGATGDQAAATAEVDRRVRERRVFTAAQNLIDAGAPNSAAVIRGLDGGLQRIGEQPMGADERARVQRMLDANAAFTGRTQPAPLPDAGTPPVDARANNSQMEALIPERGAPRVPRSQRMGIDPAAGPLSAGAAIAVDGGAHDQMLEMAAAAQAATIAQKESGRRPSTTPPAQAPGATPSPSTFTPAQSPRVAELQAQIDYIRQQGRGGWTKQMVTALRQAEQELAMLVPPTDAAPTNLREGLARARARRAAPQQLELTDAQGASAPNPNTSAAAGTVPTAGSAALEATGVAPATPSTTQKKGRTRGSQAPEAQQAAPQRSPQATADRAPSQRQAEPAGPPDAPELTALRAQLQEVERQIVAAAPDAGGDVEVAMRSRKTPVPLKAQRRRLQAAVAGWEQAQVSAAVEARANQAATSPQNDRPEPTDGQKDAGNYAMGHLSGPEVQGLRITIENPKGSTRSGTSSDGKAWTNTMAAHYGYVKGSIAADGDHVDIFVGPNPSAASTVYVVDQVNPDGSYDEAKALFGFDTKADAIAAYKGSYDRGWKVGPVTVMSVDEFKKGLASGRFKKPVAAPTPAAAKGGTAQYTRGVVEKMRAAGAVPAAPPASARRQAEALQRTEPGPSAGAGEFEDVPFSRSAGSKAIRDIYTQDLFGAPVERPADAGSDGTGVRRDVQPAAGVPADTPTPAGEYLVRTVVGTEAERKLGASAVRSFADLAAATQYLYRSAVERFDGIVTDKDGKPLAVVGGFKGALAQTTVFAPTMVAEAVRVPGAAHIWFSHNHPSGDAKLSRADEQVERMLHDVFRGSGIEPMGLIAVGNGRYSASDGDFGEIVPRATRVSVPVIEREQVPSAAERVEVSDPGTARRVAGTYYDKSGGPGAILLDTKMRVVGWMPIGEAMLGDLRGTGQLGAIYRAVSEANAGSVILAHGGELDGPHPASRSISKGQNIAAAFGKVEVRPLDMINVRTGRSAAQHGDDIQMGPVFSRRGSQTEALRRWFGDSKVVDAKGRPLVVYHGTADSFATFDKAKRGSATDTTDSREGFFFTTSTERANTAAADAGYPGGENVMPVYLSVQNPQIVRSAQGVPEETAKILRAAREAGHDGVIFERGEMGGQDIVVFEPEQIKSAIGNAGTFGPANPDVRFRRDDDAFGVQDFLRTMEKGASAVPPAGRVADVRRHVAQLTSQWANSPDVQVVASMSDPRVPASVRAYNEAQLAQGASGAPEGFFHGGKVYLLADQLAGQADVARVLFHEALGHYGLRGVFGGTLTNILNMVATTRRADVEAKAQAYGLDLKVARQRLMAAEEVLAGLAQTSPQLGVVRQAIAAIRTWLRENVPGFERLALSDAEIVRNYLAPARGWVERGATPERAQRAAAATFSRDAVPASGFAAEVAASIKAGMAEDTQALRAQVPVGIETPPALQLLGVARKPLYTSRNLIAKMHFEHGVPRSALARLGEYLSDPVMVFKSDTQPGRLTVVTKLVVQGKPVVAAIEPNGRSGRAEVVYVPTAFPKDNADRSISNWIRSGLLEYANKAESRQLATTAGLQLPGVVQRAVGFQPKYRTEADLGGDEVPFSRTKMADFRMAAQDRLAAAMSHPGTVSIWDKTVGTMRNLAERSPAFKPVYESAQRFIDDISMFANDAADTAPRLLPRVENWRDLTKKPVAAKDNAAIARPLFEGTLSWARDADGKPVRIDELTQRYAGLASEEKAQMMLRAGRLNPNVLKMWQGMQKDQFDSAVNSRFESQMLQPGVVWSDQELRDIFKADDGQISLYREARAAVERSIDMTARADMLRALGREYADLRDIVLDAPTMRDAVATITAELQDEARTNPDRADRVADLLKQVQDREEKARELVDKGYMPLSRFGRYTVDVVDAAGERQYFGMFESKAESNAMEAKMKGLYPDGKVTQGTMSQEAFKLFQGLTPESLEMFGNMLGLDGEGGAARDKAFQEYLRLAKNNHSALKRLIHRQGIAGFSEDVGRVLANFVYSNARLASGGVNAGQLERAVSEIPKEQGQLKDLAMGLQQYIQNPQEEGHAMRGMLFAQYLGGSIASALVNTTQPFAITMPWLSQYGGMRQAATQMAAAVRDIATRGKRFEADLAHALHQAEVDGVVSPQEIHQLMAQARGAGALRAGDGTRMGNARAAASNAWERTKVVWGQPFALAEQFNRRSTFIAAYRVAKAENMPNPAEFARRAVLETQFVYSKANKPQWARGPIGGTLFTFKTYSVSYLELLNRMWTQGGPEGKRAVAWAMATMMLMGGAGGLPFVEDLEDLIDAIGQALGYNISSKQWRKQALQTVIGKEMGDFVEQGISGLPGAPVDVSGRLGLGNIIPGTGLLLTKQDHSSDMLELAGPAGDLLKRGFTAAGQAFKGDIAGAALSVAPTAVSNAVKGGDMLATGMYKDRKGYKVIDTTVDEALAKAIGFQPKSVAEVQEANSYMQRAKAFYTQTSSEIKAQWAQALFEKDEAGVEAARQRAKDWNEANPEQPIVVKMTDVWKRVREMNKDRTARIEASSPKALRQRMHEMAAELR